MYRILLFSLALSAALLGCKNPKPAAESPSGPQPPSWSPAELVNNYKQGEVERCQFEEKTIYRCSMNAPDAGSEIYDDKGRQIGVCYYSTGRVDPPCEGASDCQVIYRVAQNIWGKPGVEYQGEKK